MGSLGSGLIIALFTALVGSLLAWVVGTQVTYLWDDQKRRRESDLAALARFYELYGTFFSTWKLWSASKDPETSFKVESGRWDLLEKAEIAESGFEALLVKLASERVLSETDGEMLGCFRESYQMLRESIERDRKLPWKATDSTDSTKHEGFAQYRAFKALAEYVAHLLAVPPKRDLLTRMTKPVAPQPDVMQAIAALTRITARSNFTDGKWCVIATKQLNLESELIQAAIAP